ncbi:hypothetical protein [Chromobacterium haemolyticum]|uniref:hypothetical protein n=1 Tax=Chromobacterium haemolyticum TaxID=394935 RepID=UPI0009D9FDC2|nr:hypothetical protein [Chromobacterium haemolyticum]
MQPLVGRYIAAYWQFDIAGMLAQLSPDAVFENDTNGERPPTHSGHLAERAWFSQRRQTAEALPFGLAGARIYCQTLLAQVLPTGGKAGTRWN